MIPRNIDKRTMGDKSIMEGSEMKEFKLGDVISKYRSVFDYIFQKDCKRDENSIAIEYYGNKIDRKEYWNTIIQYRKYMLGIGIKKGEPVTICMLNSPEYEYIYASLLENGSIASTVSKSFICADLKRQTVERKCKTLILSIEYADDLSKADVFSQLDANNSKDKLERIIFTSAGDYMSPDKSKEYNSQDFQKKIKELGIPNNIEIVFPGKIRDDLKKYENIDIVDDDLLDLVATYSNTGGTTGAPKCACHTHRAIISLMISHEKDVFPELDIRENARSLLVIPISHITSQFYALLLRRSHGATIFYNPDCFNPIVLREVLIEQNIDDVVLPFGLFYAITREEFKTGLKLNTPQCGGEPTPYTPTKDVDERLHKAGSNSINIGTGSTEFGSGIMASYGMEDRCNESGYFFPFAKGFLLDPFTRKKIAEKGKRGIIYANAPWQMKCYLNDEKATNDFYHYIDNDGIVYGTNNDIGEIVGYFKNRPVYSMLGRASDYIVSDNGETYYPGITIENGMVDIVDFSKGSFLFDMRDVLLNISGVMEAQPVIIPRVKNSVDGYPVMNITIQKGADPYKILYDVYDHYDVNDVKPVGIKFRTYFERSLSSDKREVLSLTDDREGYYFIDDDKEICIVDFSDEGDKQINRIDDKHIIKCVNPPKPRLVFSSIKKQGSL